MALSLERGLLNAEARVFLAVGVCGGFTTMSTFSYETLALLREDGITAGVGNTAATILTCFTAVWLGDLAGRYL
jgi:CrcB protein